MFHACPTAVIVVPTTRGNFCKDPGANNKSCQLDQIFKPSKTYPLIPILSKRTEQSWHFCTDVWEPSRIPHLHWLRSRLFDFLICDAETKYKCSLKKKFVVPLDTSEKHFRPQGQGDFVSSSLKHSHCFICLDLIFHLVQ
jgi:hypothetical protein